MKHHFEPLDGEAMLGKLAAMPIEEWSYKAQDPSIRHVGPTAQDFYGAFGLGESDKTITTSDISGINMLAVQALEARTAELRAAQAALRARQAELEGKVREMEALRAEVARVTIHNALVEERLTRLEAALQTAAAPGAP